MVDFLGIGAQKAGTSWLYEMLRLHPEIRFPAGKEVHFWNNPRGKTVADYRALFPSTPGIRQGDITPAYGILPPSTVGEIHRHFPHIPLIFLVRNPMERAWSAALMELGRAGLAYHETGDDWFMRQFLSDASRRRGDYASCLLSWLAHFPPNQLLLVYFESLRERPHEVLRTVCRHLGVSENFYDGHSHQELSRKIFAGSGQPLRESLREPLRRLIQEDMARAAALLSLLPCPRI